MVKAKKVKTVSKSVQREVKKYFPLLNIVKKLKGKEAGDLIDFLDDGAIENLCTCMYNLINTNLNFSNRKKMQLKRFIKGNCSIHNIKKITEKKHPISKRRKYLKQEGNGIPTLIAAILPFILSTFFNNKNE